MIEGVILWLCKRFKVNPIEQSRLNMGRDLVARGERWEQFYREEGGLADMIAVMRFEAFEAYADCRPSDASEKEYLAQQDRCWRMLDARVQNVIATGIAEARSREEREYLNNIEPMRKSV